MNSVTSIYNLKTFDPVDVIKIYTGGHTQKMLVKYIATLGYSVLIHHRD